MNTAYSGVIPTQRAMRCRRALLAALLPAAAAGIDNGIGVTPPMGWRSWNQFQCAINQTLVERHYELMAERTRMVDGKPTSLVDLGYTAAGIDDCWQKCSSGPDGKGFHNASGYPIVDVAVFPDMRAMTAKAKALGILPGWYGNNCHCKDERCSGDECFESDVQATLDYGFGSIKLDGCGVEKNITKFAGLFNRTGVPVMIENCHNGNPTYPEMKDGVVDCPMNFFRSSTDIRPTFGSVLINLESTKAYNGKGLTGPGCWAYPDMLEVGVTNSQRDDCPTLSVAEARTHFGAWCINSAPLVLGMDLRDAAKLDEVWPIVSNTEAIAVNQAWAGDAGQLVSESATKVEFINCSWWGGVAKCEHPSWMVWAKKLPAGRAAVLLMNNAEAPQQVAVELAKLQGLDCGAGCHVRDVWGHSDLPHTSGGSLSAAVASHDSAFLVLSPP